MKTVKVVLSCLFLAFSSINPVFSYEAANGYAVVTRVETRENEYHNIHLPNVPHQGCTLHDCVVIDPLSHGADAMLKNALLSLVAGLPANVLVEGCIPIHPSVDHPSLNNNSTAPKALRITIKGQ